MTQDRIRNFSIIAHIDHGKSTLADRILELTHAVSSRDMRAQVLDTIVERVPTPSGDPDAPARALIFDSSYDQYRGVVAFVRVVDGHFSTREPLRAMALGTRFEAEELGFFSPTRSASSRLDAGEVGYVITGLKDVSRVRVGDTLTADARGAAEPVPGYKDVKPMVFAGLFPTDSDDYPELRDALEKLKLSDAALFYEPETSQALGFGFRCGFLGLLHTELVRVDVLVGGESVDALSLIIHRDSAYDRGRALVERLQKEIPRQHFDVAIQAAIGARVIARETVKARRKDVLAKCYGGDITRKRKLLERQKAGKKRMKQVGMVEVPQEAFLAVLNLDAEKK